MKRETLTACDVSQALSKGMTELELAAGTIITDAAREQAARMGLELRVPAPGALPGAPAERVAPAASGPSAPSPLPSLPFLRPGGETPGAAQSQGGMARNLAEHALPVADLRDMVRKAVTEALERSSATVPPRPSPAFPQNACASCGACSGRPETREAGPTGAGGGGLKYSMAGRVKAVDSQKLPWEDFPGKSTGQVNIVDVITPGDGSPMGGGYLEWNNISFAWRLTYAEIDVVLEGELHISSGGKTVIGRPGDMLFIPQDTDVVFSAPGYVRFAYVTWPADWSSLVEPQGGGS